MGTERTDHNINRCVKAPPDILCQLGQSKKEMQAPTMFPFPVNKSVKFSLLRVQKEAIFDLMIYRTQPYIAFLLELFSQLEHMTA